jgi:uncharacterized protein (DUF433 family)
MRAADRVIFGGQPISRGHQLAVEHVVDMLAPGDARELEESPPTG